jgi:hypothetical protein
LRVFFATDYVEEVALGEAEVAGIGGGIVVEGFDDLQTSETGIVCYVG